MRINVARYGVTGEEIRQWLSQHQSVRVMTNDGRRIESNRHLLQNDGECSRRLILPARLYMEIEAGNYSSYEDVIWFYSMTADDMFTCECGEFRARALLIDMDMETLVGRIQDAKGVSDVYEF